MILLGPIFCSGISNSFNYCFKLTYTYMQNRAYKTVGCKLCLLHLEYCPNHPNLHYCHYRLERFPIESINSRLTTFNENASGAHITIWVSEEGMLENFTRNRRIICRSIKTRPWSGTTQSVSRLGKQAYAVILLLRFLLQLKSQLNKFLGIILHIRRIFSHIIRQHPELRHAGCHLGNRFE